MRVAKRLFISLSISLSIGTEMKFNPPKPHYKIAQQELFLISFSLIAERCISMPSIKLVIIFFRNWNIFKNRKKDEDREWLKNFKGGKTSLRLNSLWNFSFKISSLSCTLSKKKQKKLFKKERETTNLSVRVLLNLLCYFFLKIQKKKKNSLRINIWKHYSNLFEIKFCNGPLTAFVSCPFFSAQTKMKNVNFV